VCSGSLNCDGCCPLNVGCGYPASGPALVGLNCMNNGYGAYGASVFAGGGYPMGQLPAAAMMQQPQMQGPMMQSPMMQSPMMGGMPAARTVPMQTQPNTSSAAPQSLPISGPVEPVGYRSFYYGAAPYYWNNNR